MAQRDFEHPPMTENRYVRDDVDRSGSRTIVYVIGALVILGIVFVAARAFWTEPAAPPPSTVVTEPATPPAATPNTMAPAPDTTAPAPDTTAPAPQMNAPAPATPDTGAAPNGAAPAPAPAQ